MGMKREAVQEERQRTKERDSSEVESTSNMQTDMPIERILEAEKRVECKNEQPVEFEVCRLQIASRYLVAVKVQVSMSTRCGQKV